jgi:spermidine/putrescine ABC transporter ATP-binding subunit
MTELRLERLRKRFGAHLAVDALDLTISNGELMTLLGPSGSGKTTVLRIVAGYLTPDEGRVLLDETDVTSTPPEKRDIGMVFQSYALFPHRTVARNIAFGLERRKVAKQERGARVAEALARVQLSELDERYPHELSGGQQQRVALARALVIQPRLLLLDEPLSNLDAKLRGGLRLEIRRIQQDLGITTVLVTHDQEEALTVSDRIAVMNRGRIEQIGTANDLYHHPKSRFVAEFIGKMNLLRAARIESTSEGATYRLDGGATLRGPTGPPTALVGFRPESVVMGRRHANRLKGVVAQRIFLGEIVEVTFVLPDGSAIMARGSESALPPIDAGTEVEVSWPIEATRIIDEGSEE